MRKIWVLVSGLGELFFLQKTEEIYWRHGNQAAERFVVCFRCFLASALPVLKLACCFVPGGAPDMLLSNLPSFEFIACKEEGADHL